MTTSPHRILQNRTNVQTISEFIRVAWLWIAPAWAERRMLWRLVTAQARGTSGLPQVHGVLTYHRTIPIGRYELTAWEWGQGPAVLLLHAWNGQAADLTQWVQPLVKAGFRVLAADLPAHGRSSGRQASIADWRHAVLALARYAGPVHAVVGQRLGASVAALAALQGMNARRLVLQAPVADLTAHLRAQALAAGLSAARADGVLRRYERYMGQGLETLAWRRTLPLLERPTLTLPAELPPGGIARAVSFLQQGRAASIPENHESPYRAAI